MAGVFSLYLPVKSFFFVLELPHHVYLAAINFTINILESVASEADSDAVTLKIQQALGTLLPDNEHKIQSMGRPQIIL